MKRRFIGIILLAFAALSSVSAAMISQPAATVYLTRNTAISVDDLNAETERYRSLGMDVTELDVLQTMINDEVFLQGAERDGVVINDRQLDQMINTIFQNAQQQAAQSGQSVTREQFDEEIVRQFGSVDAYRAALRNQAIVQQYLMQERGDAISAAPLPSESQISSFYRQNQQSFFQPECVKLSHIYAEKTGNAEEDEAKKAELEALSAEISSGAITFESAVPEYSEDEASRNIGGDIGWLTANNTAARQGWGDEFCDTVLAMHAGEVSPVLESLMGYHIVKVTVHYDAKLLTLSDPISPEDTMTVHDYIAQGLTAQNQQSVMASELQDMIAELRGEARINILYRGNN